MGKIKPMSCVFRVVGKNFLVDEFLSQSTLTPDRIWRKGEPEFKERICESSGFSLVASEASMDNVSQQIKDAISFLRMNGEELAKLQHFPSVEEAFLDFGIADRDVAAQYDRFPPELLRLAGNLGIGIEISRYLTIADTGD